MKAKSSRDVVGWSWAASLVGPLVLLAGCNNEQGLILKKDEFLIKADGDERNMGGGCLYSTEGHRLEGGGFRDALPEGEEGAWFAFNSRYEGTGDGVRFTFVTHAGEVLAERHYDEAFLNSGRVDEVVVEFAGNTWRYLNRGVPECGPISQMEED